MIEIPEFTIYFPGCEFSPLWLLWLWIPYFIIGIFVARIVYQKIHQYTDNYYVQPEEVFGPFFSFLLWPLALTFLLIWCGHKEKGTK